ncbi:MAG: methyltransferase domain-containing protein [Acidimicrobiia bacterium]
MTGRHNDYQREYYSTRSVPRMTADLVRTPYVQRHVTEVLSDLAVPEGAKVLDLGCGPGKYTIALAERGIDVEGLDLTPALVEMLRASAPEIPVHVADAAELPGELRGRFDAVTGFFFLHHLPALAPTLASARAALRPGGRAVFLEPNPLYVGYYFQIAFTPGMTWRGERGIVHMTVRNLHRSARSAGFDNFEERVFGAVPPPIANRVWGRRLEGVLESVPGWDRIGAFRLITLW